MLTIITFTTLSSYQGSKGKSLHSKSKINMTPITLVPFKTKKDRAKYEKAWKRWLKEHNWITKGKVK